MIDAYGLDYAYTNRRGTFLSDGSPIRLRNNQLAIRSSPEDALHKINLSTVGAFQNLRQSIEGGTLYITQALTGSTSE